MKRARDIHKLLENVDLTINDSADKEVLETILGASRKSTASVSQGNARSIPTRAGLWKFAAAAVMIVAIGVGLYSAFNRELRPESGSSVISSPVSTEFGPTASFPALPEPGPREIRLLTKGFSISNEEIIHKNAKISNIGLVEFGDDGPFDRLLWHHKGERHLILERSGPLVFRRVDEGPYELAGVILRHRDELTMFDAEARLSDSNNLAIWCFIQPPAELSDLECRQRVTFFQHRNPEDLTDLRPLAELVNLEVLYVKNNSQYCEAVVDISALSNLKRLRILTLHQFSKLESLAQLGPDIEHIDLLRGYLLKDISSLKNLTKLKSLNLAGCLDIRDITALAAITELRSLELHTSKVSDISALSGMVNLKYLGLSYTKIRDLEPIGTLSGLEKLNLMSCRYISDLSPLENLENLKELNLQHCDAITDLTPLESIPKLEVLPRYTSSGQRYCRPVPA
jgi:Leucine-rich repeat (LRR) protein